MQAAFRGLRAVTTAGVVAFSFLAIVPLAHATAPTDSVVISPASPVVGDAVTATGPYRECPDPGPTYLFTVSDGTQIVSSGTGTAQNDGSGVTYNFTPGHASATYNVTMDAKCVNGTPVDADFESGNFEVKAALGGSISTSPSPPVVNQPATISVAPSGGNPGYTYSWDLNNDGTFGDDGGATGHSVPWTFTTTGAHTVRVKITDGQPGNVPPVHTVIVTKTITVAATGGGQPPPPPCVKRVAFQLSEFTTNGCFTKTSSSPERWVSTDAIKLNGVAFPDFGQTFTVTAPTVAEPGGHFTAPNSTIQLDKFTAFSGSIDWSLPAGGPGDEQVLHSFSVAAGASLLGLKVRGSVALNLGRDASGAYYADFPLSIQLPASFTAGPDPSFGSVTGAASLRVDDAGIHYNGLRLEAENVWLGKLKVNSVCFSYIPSGGLSTAPCDTPTFGGGDEPFIQCNSDPTTNRWDASADIELPSGLELGAFGGLANGQISKLGGSIGNLERRAPIADGVYLDHVAFGLCLSPPPFKIRANIGANFLGNRHLVALDGGFTYTDSTPTSPWSLELDGDLTVGDTPIGSGTLGINGSGLIDFGVQTGIDLYGIASLNAQVSGWIDAPNHQFVVSGSGQGCLGSACAGASGELSSTGVAGCVTVGTSTPTYNLIIPLDGGAPYLDTNTYDITAGFGYVWGASSVDMLGGSCDFSAYEPTQAAADRAAGASAGIRVRIAHGTDAVSLRIHGSHGPPKVVLRGPHGVTITSPANAISKLSKGHYLLVANKTDGTTDVMLVRPAAGMWTVSQAAGSMSSPTKIDRANLEVPPTFGARVLGKGESRTLRVAYAVPVGTSVRLVERGKRVDRTIAADLHGRRCPGLPRMRPGTNEKILCATIRFRPSPGPGGRRAVQAVVTRRGMPLFQKSIASFHVPRPTLPSRVKKLRARRGRGFLLVGFAPSAGASRYAVSAKLSDGRELAFDLGGGCRALRIARVPAGVAATVKIAGVRYDLAVGRANTISIKANKRSVGRGAKKWRPGKICS